MRRFQFIMLSCVFGLAAALADDDTSEVDCGDFDPSNFIEGKPIIRVEPTLGAKLREDDIEGCIVVVYGLKEKPGTDGAALLASRPKAIAYSEEVPRNARKAAERALKKWLFFAKTHDASSERLYFSVFRF